jgi:hypothetical protein
VILRLLVYGRGGRLLPESKVEKVGPGRFVPWNFQGFTPANLVAQRLNAPYLRRNQRRCGL